MTLFRYEVTDRRGDTLRGVMEAETEAQVRNSLASRGYSIRMIECSEPRISHSQDSTAVGARRPTSRLTTSPKELAIFFKGMASYLSAGMTAYQALANIARETPSRSMRTMAEQMAARVETGMRLSDAMNEFPRAFPPHIVSTVNAAETGGLVAEVLADIALDYELNQRASNLWAKRLNRILWASAFLGFIAAPLLPMIFTPGTTNLQEGLIRYAYFTARYVAFPLALVVIGYKILASMLRSSHLRPIADAVILRVPGNFGATPKTRALASFSRILMHLVRAGVPLGTAWGTASRVCENVAVGKRLLAQEPTIRAGGKLSEAMAASTLFRPDDVRNMATGERTGQLVEATKRLAEYYEDSARSAASQQAWLSTKLAILANIIATAAIIFSIALMYGNMLEWVEWFFGAN